MMALQGHVGDFAVFGDDYDTPDGTAIRDYIHVTDLAAAHLAALKLLLTGHAGGSFNLGTGTGFSVREILSAIHDETGREVPHVVKPRRAAIRPIWSPTPQPREKCSTSCRVIRILQRSSAPPGPGTRARIHCGTPRRNTRVQLRRGKVEQLSLIRVACCAFSPIAYPSSHRASPRPGPIKQSRRANMGRLAALSLY